MKGFFSPTGPLAFIWHPPTSSPSASVCHSQSYPRRAIFEQMYHAAGKQLSTKGSECTYNVPCCKLGLFIQRIGSMVSTGSELTQADVANPFFCVDQSQKTVASYRPEDKSTFICLCDSIIGLPTVAWEILSHRAPILGQLLGRRVAKDWRTPTLYQLSVTFHKGLALMSNIRIISIPHDLLRRVHKQQTIRL